MDPLPRVDTSLDTITESARSSYSSRTDSQSSRSSYSSLTDSLPSSVRTSYSSLPESSGKTASFSRTSSIFTSDSAVGTPLSSKESSSRSPTRWNIEDLARRSSQFPPRSSCELLAWSEGTVRDGMTALHELQNVKNMVCVAFGAFDRYYVSWEDNDGEFHQENQNLPEILHSWIFLPQGQTRHIPSLQVSFGSNDDFFASDQDGKISSRDFVQKVGEKKPASDRVTEVTKGIMKGKSRAASSPTFPTDMAARSELMPTSLRLERRNTFQLGQRSPQSDSGPRPMITPLVESPRLVRRRSELVSTSVADPELPPNPESLRVQTRVEIQQLPIRMESKKAFGHMIEKQLLSTIESKTSGVPMNLGSSLSRLESKHKISPFGGKHLLTRLDSKADMPKSDDIRKERMLVGMPPVRPPWPRTKILALGRERLRHAETERQTMEEVADSRLKSTAYVDAAVQTDKIEDICAAFGQNFLQSVTVSPLYSIPPPQKSMSFGSMQEICRGQYSLGDTLRYYT